MAWSTLWLWAVTLAGSSAVAPGLAGTRVHTIEMDIAWVDANVQRTDVPAGATKAGEAFARALKTDVRAALGASTDSAVGLRIRIDATTLPTVSLYRRVAFRRMRVLDDGNGAGATCESTCYDATGNESCPTVTYLEIVGNRSSGPGLNLPVLRPMKPEDSLLPVPPIFGLFYVDVATNATANGSLSCGVSYESPPHRNKVSSPTLFLVLRNIVVSNTARLPAVLVRTYVMHATVATRAVSFLSEGVTFWNNSGRALLLEGAGNVLAHVNNSRFEWNAGGALAINQPALTPSPTSITRARLAGGRVEVHVETCTFHENGRLGNVKTNGSAILLVSASTNHFHELTVANTVTSATPSSPGSSCQFHVHSVSSLAQPSVFIQSSVTPPVLASCMIAEEAAVTSCAAGQHVDGIVNCASCTPGRASLGGASALCTECTPGYVAPVAHSTSCLACGVGRTSALSATSLPELHPSTDETSRDSVLGEAGGVMCVNCTPGRRAESAGAIACEACIKGRASKSIAVAECGVCLSGKYIDVVGASVCKVCAPGYYRGDSHVRLSVINCAACQPGKYASHRGATQCKPCAVGYFAPNTSSAGCAHCFDVADTSLPSSSANDSSLFADEDMQVGATICAAKTKGSVGDNSTAGQRPQNVLVLAIGLSIGAVVVISAGLGTWVWNQRKRRRAALVDPNFPGRGEVEAQGGQGQGGVELSGRSPSMILADNALSPARIIETEFRIHDRDSDGHINFHELTGLVMEVMVTHAVNTPRDAHQLTCEKISEIILRSIDDDGNGMLEKTEFTMLCLRVMRMAGRDDEVERLKRMVSDASDEDIAIIKMFFHTMNSWFLRKIERLQHMFPDTPNSPSGIYERSRVVESRPAEKV